MIGLPAAGHLLYRCRLCAWLGEVRPALADDPWHNSFAPGVLGLPQWSLHRCDDKQIGIADLVGFAAPPPRADEEEE